MHLSHYIVHVYTHTCVVSGSWNMHVRSYVWNIYVMIHKDDNFTLNCRSIVLIVCPNKRVFATRNHDHNHLIEFMHACSFIRGGGFYFLCWTTGVGTIWWHLLFGVQLDLQCIWIIRVYQDVSSWCKRWSKNALILCCANLILLLLDLHDLPN